MSVLSDRSIRGLSAEQLSRPLLIQPFKLEQLQSASYDVLLGEELYWPDTEGWLHLSRCEDQTYYLDPGDFVLGHTIEGVWLGDDLVGKVEGKSSLGRQGLVIHATAGFIDPGFEGQITLELHNLGRMPIALKLGMRIAQLAFQWLDVPCERPYGHDDLGSHYQGQRGAVAARP